MTILNKEKMMAKWTLITIMMILLFAPVVAQNEQIAEDEEFPVDLTGPQPLIEIPEQRFDFGFSPEGYYLVHSFKVRNAGEGELRIQRVRTTCGCTNAPMKKMQLDPGEETEVTVVFNSARYFHKTSKSAIINSNDPVNRSIRVTFSADMDSVGLPLNVVPRALDIPRGEDPPKQMVFKIENPTESEVELEIIDYTADVFAVPKLKDKKLKPGKSTELTLELCGDYDCAATYIKASVTLEARGIPGDPVFFTIPVKGSGPQ